MRSKSVDVLNEADAYERKLNWQLFKYEQDAQLWGPRMEAPDDWYPGFPMHSKPRRDISIGVNGLEIVYQGNCVRWMAEEFEDGNAYWLSDAGDSWNICNDCEVGWLDVTAPCWICGKQCYWFPDSNYLYNAIDQNLDEVYQLIGQEMASYSVSMTVSINNRPVEEYVLPGVPIWLGLDERISSEPTIVFPENPSYESAVPLPDPPFPEFNAENRAHSEYLSFENLWNRRR